MKRAVLTAGALAACAATSMGLADDDSQDGMLVTADRAGRLGTLSTTQFDPGATRRVAHQRRDDPLFAPVDGSDCPATQPGQRPDAGLSSMLLRYGLIRVQLAVPPAAQFSLTAATNPLGCAIPPGDASIGHQLFLFRRPLPSANLIFLSAVMWDGRETVQKIATTPGMGNTGPLVAGLASQANDATLGHAQGAQPITGTQAQADIVAFEQNLFTAQVTMEGTHLARGNGGPRYLAETIAPAFFIGQNDPLASGFTSNVFTLYSSWERGEYEGRDDLKAAIGRGERLFNTRTFTIANVAGLNSAAYDPLYNPDDPLANKPITGTCGTCHNTPNVGNHSTPLAINIGATMAVPTDNNGVPIAGILDTANLPVYTLTANAGGASVQVTDPGRALISGRWVDVGKTKGPVLRGLAARAPYFHNGAAKDLRTAVRFYDARFNIGLTPREVSDLVAFLSSL